jgi:uncharacterized protein YcgL (UPF0745 family)
MGKKVSFGNENRLCEIYRCSKKEGMYIYVDKKAGIEKLPDALRKKTGKLVFAMGLVITPDKKLARANAKDVLIAIEAQGFYLQMPPSLYGEAQASSSAITEANDFLEREH